MTWRVMIHVDGPEPDTLHRAGFATKREARIWADREVGAAKELFDDGRTDLTVQIEREEKRA